MSKQSKVRKSRQEAKLKAARHKERDDTEASEEKEESENMDDSESDDDEEEDDEDEEDEEGNEVPQSFLEKQRLSEFLETGVRVPVKDDTNLPNILKEAFEVERKYMLTHKGAVSVTAFHKPRSLLAIGYDSGIFAIHYVAPIEDSNANNGSSIVKSESNTSGANADTLPLIHLLSISAQALTAACFAPSGDLVAFGSAHLKQLLVWDWKNEAYVLKEQAHYYDIARCAITSDALHIISGGDDGKVKVWKVSSGQCLVTFTEHTGPITGIAVSSSTNAIFTCSSDGTARGFDLVRYRAFRVFTIPEESQQLSCIAVDPSGEVLALGSGRRNRIYLFAVQTGKVIDTLQGHEAPIACLAFHPGGTTLTSGSLDSQLILWDVFSSNDGGARLKGDGEVLDIDTEVLSLTYSASGRRMAVLTAKQEVMVYETTLPSEPELIKTFSVGFDASGGWNKSIGPRSANYDAHFTRMTFSPEGEKLLLGGDSKWLVLYHATQGYVLKKWPITTNLDVQGAEEQFQWRRMTEAGMMDEIDIADDDVHLHRRQLLEMPGSKHRHFATGQRKTELVARTMDLAFAPTASEFVAATTDGLLVFSLFVSRPRFTPLQLTSEITIERIKSQLHQEHQPVLALMGALLLGERVLGVECMRRIAPEAIPVAVSATPSSTYTLLMQWVSEEVLHAPGLEHALLWAQSLLVHSSELLHGTSHEMSRLHGPLKLLMRALQSHRALSDLAKENYFALRYLRDMAQMNKHTLKPIEDEEEQEGEAEEVGGVSNRNDASNLQEILKE